MGYKAFYFWCCVWLGLSGQSVAQTSSAPPLSEWEQEAQDFSDPEDSSTTNRKKSEKEKGFSTANWAVLGGTVGVFTAHATSYAAIAGLGMAAALPAPQLLFALTLAPVLGGVSSALLLSALLVSMDAKVESVLIVIANVVLSILSPLMGAGVGLFASSFIAQRLLQQDPLSPDDPIPQAHLIGAMATAAVVGTLAPTLFAGWMLPLYIQDDLVEVLPGDAALLQE